MEKFSNSSELAFNVTQMAGAISLILADKLNHEEIIDQIELFDSETIYASIEYGQKQKFETLLRAGYNSLLINMTTIEEAKSFLDLLVQLRDKFDDAHRLILLANYAIAKMIDEEFSQLKGYGLEVFTLQPQEDEREKIIQSFEEKYQMSSDEFLERWKAGELKDTEEFNRWYVLL
ncbi:MAG: hypothetical protein U9N49_10670 [Campylobacterota bacterium]|nr:hypothetical protein [Campylobacterota bacterium]